VGQISVPVAAFRDGELPPVCVKTGGRAQRMVAVQATRTPRWTWWLLPFGPLAFLLVRWLLRRQVTGWVPMSRSAARQLEGVRWLGWVSLLLAVVSAFLGDLVGSPQLARVGLVALATAVAAELAAPLWSVGARLDPSRMYVALTRVDPKFHEAVVRGGFAARSKD
jgi:hypothetical protein